MKYIVVHAGRRDDYQVALALAEVNALHFLVTDFYAPFNSKIGGKLLGILPAKLQSLFNKRYKHGLSSSLVMISYWAIFYEILLKLTGNIKYSTLKDKALGLAARKLSIKKNVPIISMNTYAKYAFEDNKVKPKILFQFHPHTSFVKNLLEEEMAINPISKESLSKEYEFSVSPIVLKNLSSEIHLADQIICASTITAESLYIENIAPSKIKIIPYGIDTQLFPYKSRKERSVESLFKVIFIGSLNQRKGITYLLEALQNMTNVQLTIVGRGIFDEKLLSNFNVDVKIRQNIPHSEMLSLLHDSHCFVLPSLIEGFGQVILEAMSTGIPVIASKNTVAQDIIIEGNNGFVVPIRNSAKIKCNIEYLKNNPSIANRIGENGFKTVKDLNWKKFRSDMINHLQNIT